jgi:hypothetical protein
MWLLRDCEAPSCEKVEAEDVEEDEGMGKGIGLRWRLWPWWTDWMGTSEVVEEDESDEQDDERDAPDEEAAGGDRDGRVKIDDRACVGGGM